jgi:hypothetical protein
MEEFGFLGGQKVPELSRSCCSSSDGRRESHVTAIEIMLKVVEWIENKRRVNVWNLAIYKLYP